eukprot:351318_1
MDYLLLIIIVCHLVLEEMFSVFCKLTTILNKQQSAHICNWVQVSSSFVLFLVPVVTDFLSDLAWSGANRLIDYFNGYCSATTDSSGLRYNRIQRTQNEFQLMDSRI